MNSPKTMQVVFCLQHCSTISMQSQPSSQSSSIKQVVVLLPSSRRVPFTGSSKVKFDSVGDFVETATGEFVIIPFGERLGETLVWLVSGTGTGTGTGVGAGGRGGFGALGGLFGALVALGVGLGAGVGTNVAQGCLVALGCLVCLGTLGALVALVA